MRPGFPMPAAARRLALAAGLALAAPMAQASTVGAVSFLGSLAFATGTQFGGAEVGGLSGLAPLGGDAFRAVSDSPTDPRTFDLRIDAADGTLDPGDVTFTAVNPLNDAAGAPLPDGTRDFEGIAVGAAGRTFLADEAAPGIEAFDTGFDRARSYAPPAAFVPGAGTGTRPNLAFESLTLTPDGATLVTATEAALAQDGPVASTSAGTASRLLTIDRASGVTGPEYVYLTEPDPAGIVVQGTGLVELVALDDAGTFLALERVLGLTGGFDVRLYEISTAGATDVSGDDPLAGFTPVSKRLLSDFSELGAGLDNLEGMALGSWLDGDTRALFLVSDNNFQSLQRTQFVALGLEIAPTTAVPLPPAALALGVALLGLGAFGRRKRDSVPRG